MNVSFKYRVKVKASDIFTLTNRGYVVQRTDVETEFWLLTNSPQYLLTFLAEDEIEVIVQPEEIPQG